MNSPAGIKLLKFDFTHIELKRSTDFVGGEVSIRFDLSNTTDPENTRVINSHITLTLSPLPNETEELPHFLQVAMTGAFEIVGEIPNDALESLKNINMPSILFPYIRALVSNITTLSGMNPVILPAVNFVAIQQQAQVAASVEMNG